MPKPKPKRPVPAKLVETPNDVEVEGRKRKPRSGTENHKPEEPAPKKIKRKSKINGIMENGNGSVVIRPSQGQNRPDETKTITCVKAVLKAHGLKESQKKQNRGKGKENLFADDGEKVQLQIAAIKLPKDSRQHLVRTVYQHGHFPDPVQTCLLVKDRYLDIKDTQEESIQEYREMFQRCGVAKELITTIIPLDQLRKSYNSYEGKNKLALRYDLFLADQRIMSRLPKMLGKAFYSRKKHPIPVNLDKEDRIHDEIGKGLRTSTLPLDHHGSCALVQVGHTLMTPDDLADNVKSIYESLGKRYPGGWKNIRSIHLKTATSAAVPLYVNTGSVNDVGFVDAKLPTRKVEAVTGELSTKPGYQVTVTPSGDVKLTKLSNEEAESD